MRPTIETPSASRPRNHAAAIPPPTATSGAGECGQSRSITTRIASVAIATASVSTEVSGTCWTTLSRSGKKPCLVMWVPSSLGIWSSTITRPMPALNPVRTGAEMKSATKPRRISRATHEHDADQRGQRRGGRHELARVAVGNHQRQLGAGEDRQRRRRADAEHARRAEQRVDDHRNERGVEADRHRQPGDCGIRHRLGQHHRGRGEAGDDVEAPWAAGRRLCADEGNRTRRSRGCRVSGRCSLVRVRGDRHVRSSSTHGELPLTIDSREHGSQQLPFRAALAEIGRCAKDISSANPEGLERRLPVRAALRGRRGKSPVFPSRSPLRRSEPLCHSWMDQFQLPTLDDCFGSSGSEIGSTLIDPIPDIPGAEANAGKPPFSPPRSGQSLSLKHARSRAPPDVI